MKLLFFLYLFGGYALTKTVSDREFRISYKITKNKDCIIVDISKKNISENDTIISYSLYDNFTYGINFFEKEEIDSVINFPFIDQKEAEKSRVIYFHNHMHPYDIFYPKTKRKFRFKISKDVYERYSHIGVAESYDIIKNNDYSKHYINGSGRIYRYDKSQKTFYIPLWDKRKKK